MLYLGTSSSFDPVNVFRLTERSLKVQLLLMNRCSRASPPRWKSRQATTKVRKSQGPGRSGPRRSAQRGVFRTIEGERLHQITVRARQRQQEALRKPTRHIAAHLGEPLQCCLARKADLPAMRGAGDIAEAQPCVIVRGADDSVEIDFLQLAQAKTPFVARSSPKTL